MTSDRDRKVQKPAFDEPRGLGETLSLVRELSHECAALGGPLCKELNDLVQRGAYREVVERELIPQSVDESQLSDYLYARQIKGLLEKQDFLDLGYDRERAAVEKFIAAERKCRVTNERLWSERPKWDVSGVLHTAQRIIAQILGPVPSYADLPFRFGPGATTNVVGRVANFRAKLAAPMQCSQSLVSGLGEFLEEFPLWCDTVATEHLDGAWRVAVEVRPARLGFVPKTSKTHRTICVEPVLNALGQKGIGTYMKKRLGLFGVNLRDQSVNQRYALRGSIDGSLATVDLSSASDTVSYALVMSLLPIEWFDLLDRFRSECVEVPGGVLELEKFSSMGNAYTFELESVIFYALALSVCDYLDLVGKSIFGQKGELLERSWPISVFGDDIIVPVDAYSLLLETLNWCGFETNVEKSFSTGFFRESCGADWLNGFDVRPFYLKKEVSDRVLFMAHNFFMRKGERSLARICFNRTLKELRLMGPDGYGDGHLIGAYTLRPSRKEGWEGGSFRSWKGSPRLDDRRERQTDVLIPAYAIAARQSEEDPTYLDFLEEVVPVNPYILRGTKDYRTTSIYTTREGIFRPW
jgi:hypothetical protein